jgi:hypothetical protein
MSRLETVIEQEKEISYFQGNKDLFSSHILILINQEQAARKFKRKIFISLLLGLGGVSVLLSLGGVSFLLTSINEMAGYFIVNPSSWNMVDILEMVSIYYGLLFVLLTSLKHQRLIFN